MALSRVDAALLGVDRDDPLAVEQALAGLAASDLPDDEAALLLRLRAMVAERLGRTDEALALLDAARERSDDPETALQAGMALQVAGRFDDAAEAFVRAGADGHDDPARALAALRFLYLLDRPADGLRLLEPLFRTVRDLGRAEAGYLRGRGLPAFGVLLAHHALFSRMAGRPDRTVAMTTWAAGALEGDEVEDQCRLAAAFASADREAYGAWLHDWATGETGEASPSARRLAWALHRARESEPLGRALAHLDAARPGEDAPGWLEDLRTLGRAETFHRFGMERDEGPWREKLLRAQPLLFEPEHVVLFDLHAYQERLKPLWRTARSG